MLAMWILFDGIRSKKMDIYFKLKAIEEIGAIILSILLVVFWIVVIKKINGRK